MKNKSYTIRFSAENDIQRLYENQQVKLTDVDYSLAKTEKLSVMVWNIFKQKRDDWLPVLQNHAHNLQLVLLQEAQSTPELINFATSHYLVADQVPALKLSPYFSGVMTLSSAYPIYCCPLKSKEPLLRLAKSALITIYPLYDQRLLMVVNVHAINFSVGLDFYQQQLDVIKSQVKQHIGPVIFAGDFNTWSRARLHMLYRYIREMKLQKVNFSIDSRKKVFGLPLDFVFYRELTVESSSILMTKASDHNPLVVHFNLNG